MCRKRISIRAPRRAVFIDLVRRALDQPQRGEVVLDRVGGVVKVEHRDQDIRKHVAGDENTVLLGQQRRAARRMLLMPISQPRPLVSSPSGWRQRLRCLVPTARRA